MRIEAGLFVAVHWNHPVGATSAMRAIVPAAAAAAATAAAAAFWPSGSLLPSPPFSHKQLLLDFYFHERYDIVGLLT